MEGVGEKRERVGKWERGREREKAVDQPTQLWLKYKKTRTRLDQEENFKNRDPQDYKFLRNLYSLQKENVKNYYKNIDITTTNSNETLLVSGQKVTFCCKNGNERLINCRVTLKWYSYDTTDQLNTSFIVGTIVVVKSLTKSPTLRGTSRTNF